MTGWGIMFICGMVIQYAGTLKPTHWSLDQLQQIWQLLSYIYNADKQR